MRPTPRLPSPLPRPLPARHRLPDWLPAIAAGLLLVMTAACGSTGYQPVTEKPFQSVVAEGCGKEGSQVTTTAKVHRVYEDTLVLWDGADADTIVTLSLPTADLGERAAGLVTQNRFEKAFEALQGARERDNPVTVTATCRERNQPARVSRFSYRDADNQRREIELED